MNAVVTHEYGGPEVLQYEQWPDPVPGPGQVLVRVAATSVNPIDVGRRSGKMKQEFPIQFPGILGVDVAGTVAKVGPGVTGFSVGDLVFAAADQTYAELCVVDAKNLAKVPDGLALVDAAALPLVTMTGSQLISVGTGVGKGQTVIVTGAVGNVGRSAVFTAKERGATVIAAVLRRQFQAAGQLGADHIIATDDPNAISTLSPVDAVADTVDGATAELLLAKIKPGGVFATVVGVPASARQHPAIRSGFVGSQPDTATLKLMAEAVCDGRLGIPIGKKLPLRDAPAAHRAVEAGGAGKVLLVI